MNGSKLEIKCSFIKCPIDRIIIFKLSKKKCQWASLQNAASKKLLRTYPLLTEYVGK